DYLSRWNKLFGDKGFRRLCDEGAGFQNCHYPYAATLTGPGHASVHTGCSPRTHGIIGNNWFDRRAGHATYCTTSSRHHAVPPQPSRRRVARPILDAPKARPPLLPLFRFRRRVRGGRRHRAGRHLSAPDGTAAADEEALLRVAVPLAIRERGPARIGKGSPRR